MRDVLQVAARGGSGSAARILSSGLAGITRRHRRVAIAAAAAEPATVDAPTAAALQVWGSRAGYESLVNAFEKEHPDIVLLDADSFLYLQLNPSVFAAGAFSGLRYPSKRVVVRDSERVIIPERGARLGNFGITEVSADETWVVETGIPSTPAPVITAAAPDSAATPCTGSSLVSLMGGFLVDRELEASEPRALLGSGILGRDHEQEVGHDYNEPRGSGGALERGPLEDRSLRLDRVRVGLVEVGRRHRGEPERRRRHVGERAQGQPGRLHRSSAHAPQRVQQRVHRHIGGIHREDAGERVRPGGGPRRGTHQRVLAAG